MDHVVSPAHVTVSFDRYGSGPPLVLVHGTFSDFRTNWEFVKPLLEQEFTIYAIARRGRGKTDATTGHSLEDESSDLVTLILKHQRTCISFGSLLWSAYSTGWCRQSA